MGTLDVHLLAVALMGTPKHLEEKHAATVTDLNLRGQQWGDLAANHILVHAYEMRLDFERSTEELRRLVSLSPAEADLLAEQARTALI